METHIKIVDTAIINPFYFFQKKLTLSCPLCKNISHFINEHDNLLLMKYQDIKHQHIALGYLSSPPHMCGACGNRYGVPKIFKSLYHATSVMEKIIHEHKFLDKHNPLVYNYEHIPIIRKNKITDQDLINITNKLYSFYEKEYPFFCKGVCAPY